MGWLFRVALQGISADRSEATGDYDTVEAGDLDAGGIADLLEALAPLAAPPGKDGRRGCPPYVHVVTESGTRTFEMQGGEIFSLDEGGVLSVPDAVALVTGEEVLEETPEEDDGQDALADATEVPDEDEQVEPGEDDGTPPPA